MIAPTPIGHDADASSRLRDVLARADIVAAEDTRRARDLCSRLGISLSGKLMSVFEHNEAQRCAAICDAIEAGSEVVLMSDAGTPLVNDPGYRLVCECLRRGITVSALAGPSAVTTALAVSGLPPDRFIFDGFVPRKSGQRVVWLESLRTEKRTVIFF